MLIMLALQEWSPHTRNQVTQAVVLVPQVNFFIWSQVYHIDLDIDYIFMCYYMYICIYMIILYIYVHSVQVF